MYDRVKEEAKLPGNKVLLGRELDHVIGFRLRPGEMLCYVKLTGEVLWEDDLPDQYCPTGKGKLFVLRSED